MEDFDEITPEALAYDEVDSSGDAIKKAEEQGLRAVAPQRDELFIDIDQEEDMIVFHKNLEIFKRFPAELAGEVLSEVATPSRSGAAGKYHVIVRFSKSMTDEERVTYQAILGSDRTRDALSLVRARRDDPHPTLFFEKK